MKLKTQMIGHKDGKEVYLSNKEFEAISYVDLFKGLLEIVKEHEYEIEDVQVNLRFKGKSIEMKKRTE